MSNIPVICITCESNSYIETVQYEYVLYHALEYNVYIPTIRILKSRENNPKTVKLFRSQRYTEIYSEFQVLPWNILEVITFHPIYRVKTKHYFYIENSDHVTFTIVTHNKSEIIHYK
jgi:uncharacterized membrane protein